MRNLRVPRVLVAAIIITVVGSGAWLVQSSLQRATPAAQASVTTKMSTANRKAWLIPTQEYQHRFPPAEQTSQAANASGESAIPAMIKNGPMSKRLTTALAPILASYTGQELSTSDEQAAPNPIGAVKWQAKTGGGEILATMQRLTRPLPIGMIGGNDNAPVGHLPSGSEYIIIEHAPFFRQLIIVKPNGMFFQITASVVPRGEATLGIDQAQFVRIATAIDASGRA